MPQVAAAAVAAFAAIGSAVAAAGTAIATGLAAIGTAAAGTGLTAALAQAAISTAISVGTNLVFSALAPKPRAEASRVQLQTRAGPISPRELPLGRTATAGVLVSPALYSGRGNRYGTYVYTLSGAGAHGTVESILWGEDTVSVNANGSVSGKYAGRMWCFQRSGDWAQSAININSQAGLPNNAQPAQWTANHRQAGCMHVLLVLEYGHSVFGGQIQTPVFVVNSDLLQLIDPRTLAPAVGAARSLPHVWAYSWRRGWFAPNGTRVLGIGQPAAEIDAAAYAFGANNDAANGFAVSGLANAAEDRFAVETLILEAGAAAVTERGGLASVAVAAPQSIVGTIGPDDLRAPLQWRRQARASDRPTAANTEYRSEANRWQMVEGREVTDPAWTAADAGRVKKRRLTFAYAGGGGAHVGKLAYLALANAREPLEFTIPCMPRVRFVAFAGDCARLLLPGLGIDSKIRITSRTSNPDGTVDLVAVTETDSKYAAAGLANSAPPPATVAPVVSLANPPQPEAAAWTATALAITSGGTQLPIVRVAGSSSDWPYADSVVMRLRLAGAGNPWVSVEAVASQADAFEFRGLTPATAYVVGVSYRSAVGAEGPIRELAAVTTPAFVAGQVAGAGNTFGTNRYRQAAAPATPIDGDIWEDTSGSPVVVRRRSGGVWLLSHIEGADITGQNVAAGFAGQGPLATSAMTEPQVRGRFLGPFANEAAAIAAGLQDGDTYFDTTLQANRGRSGGVTTTTATVGGGGPPAARAGQASAIDIGVSGTAWTLAATLNLPDVAAGIADLSLTNVFPGAGATVSPPSTQLMGEWRIRRASTVIASGSWTAIDQGGGFVEVTFDGPTTAAVPSGAATYSLDLRRVFGATDATGLSATLYVNVTQS